jgi:hypothetical protein
MRAGTQLDANGIVCRFQLRVDQGAKRMGSAGRHRSVLPLASVALALGHLTSDGYSARVLSLPMRLSSRNHVGGYRRTVT